MKKCLNILFLSLICLTVAVACTRGPELHLFRASEIEMTPTMDLDIDTYWDYQFEIDGDETYDWRKEWYYGWDNTDLNLFGPIGYTKPESFNIRRYHKHNTWDSHTTVYKDNGWSGKHFRATYDFGFWDILIWNENTAPVQGLIIDENTNPDAVTGYTNQVVLTTRSAGRIVYQPEELFSGYMTNIEITPEYKGFERRILEGESTPVWYRKTDIMLRPYTYIYLTQLILKHNNGKIAGVDGSARLSGLARSVCLNTGISSSDDISVGYDVRLKNACDMEGESVDIVGGRLLCFGMCNLNPNMVDTKSPLVKNLVRASDHSRHYIDLQMQFNNGIDSTFVFDVTDQLRERYKGGVLTIIIDMDTVAVPSRGNGSAFDAVVLDYQDGGTHEFEM